MAAPAGPPPAPVFAHAENGRPWAPQRRPAGELPPALPLAVGWTAGALVGLGLVNGRASTMPRGGRIALIFASAFAGTILALAAAWALPLLTNLT